MVVGEYIHHERRKRTESEERGDDSDDDECNGSGVHCDSPLSVGEIENSDQDADRGDDQGGDGDGR